MNATLRTLLGMAVLLISTVPTTALATLGERAASITGDREALSAVAKKMTEKELYTVHEMASEGTTVREFVNASGVVFAVAWNGIVKPDLAVVLGAYHEDYKNARRQMPHKHGQKQSLVRGDRVVVETWGHMRNLHGRAYDPALVPEGVNLDEIR